MTPSAEPVRVLPPAHGFDALCDTLTRAGWRLVSQSSAPILPGEPEQASFERQGRALFYTFNPVCRLRLLDTARAGAWDADATPRVDLATVGRWLADADERTALRGILAAQALHAVALAPQVQALQSHPRAALAQAAQRALVVLRGGHEPDPRETALAAADVLRRQLEPLLLSLAHDGTGAIAASLQPREGDFALAFKPEWVDAAREAYAAAWPQPARAQRASSRAQVRVHVAPAGMLAHANELSRHFPSGYRGICAALQAQRVWAAWKTVEPGADAGMAYDGMVWLDDHWAWFPKPYRVLGALMKTRSV
ncbi:hypothetical protein [Hydrogenophaga sp. BPS33]|uniref:hypothetical protein n=1 Tax=Hydrogenophaga sp. BPS33 TaxID=2651974 RepID=UPI0013202FE9|nr:hypothetical protein [Hydrogenophaga sp. BPS33]QHE85175.1 hypothetical protein F9K07_09885 [Hydrogenophaga sp. BPS33]